MLGILVMAFSKNLEKIRKEIFQYRYLRTLNDKFWIGTS